MYSAGQPSRGTASGQHAIGTLRNGRCVGALSPEHGGHMVRERLAVDTNRRVQAPVKFRAVRQKGRVRTQKSGHLLGQRIVELAVWGRHGPTI